MVRAIDDASIHPAIRGAGNQEVRCLSPPDIVDPSVKRLKWERNMEHPSNQMMIEH